MKWREDRSKAWSVLEGVLPIFLILGWMAGVAWSDNSLCLGCHQDESLKKQDARGKTISLFVSEANFKNSAHGKLSCSDCHTRVKDDKHAEGGQKAADKRVNCATCHEKADKEYQQGLHSKMIMKGMERAANCYDCHGKHNILASKNSKSMTHISNIDKACNRCHAGSDSSCRITPSRPPGVRDCLLPLFKKLRKPALSPVTFLAGGHRGFGRLTQHSNNSHASLSRGC